ncbi:MAG: hypothetical protein K2G16_00060 [Lachnospiraceae bacterium]|nr:hypothetical protein [Lachnospiraceae bacterium]
MLESKHDVLEGKLDSLESKHDSLVSDIKEIKQKVNSVENKVTNMDLTLENEIRVNIKRVAEGHLDLSRNLHNALSIDNEKEMLSIRVNMLETELRKIKVKLENIA